MDQLHELVVKLLENGGASKGLVRLLRDELQSGGITGSKDSGLFQIFRYANDGTVDLSVSGLGGVLCEVVSQAALTVHELKCLIEARTQIPAREQRLAYKGYAMQDDKALWSYGVTPLSPCIDLVRSLVWKLVTIGGRTHDGQVLATGPGQGRKH